MRKNTTPGDLAHVFSETGLAFWLLFFSTVDATSLAYSQTVVNLRTSIPEISQGLELFDWAIAPLFIVSAGLIYLFIEPNVIRRRNGGSTLVLPGDPLADRINILADLAEVTRPAVFRSNSGFGQSAQAFGSLSFSVRVGRGMDAVLLLRPQLFDAIILHELGHIKNRDVRKAYLNRGLVRSFSFIVGLVLAILYFLVIYYGLRSTWCVGTGISTCVRNITVHLVGNTLVYVPTVVTVIVSYALFLRIREFQADGVSARLGGRDELMQAFSSAQAIPKKSLSAFALHPTPAERKRALERPVTVLRSSRWLMLATACLLSVLTNGVQSSPSVPNWASGIIKQWQQVSDGIMQPTFSFVMQSLLLYSGFVGVTLLGVMVLIAMQVRNGIYGSRNRILLRASIKECLVGVLLFCAGFFVLGDIVMFSGALVNNGWRDFLDRSYFGHGRDMLTVALVFATLSLLAFVTGLVCGRLIDKLRYPRVFFWCCCVAAFYGAGYIVLLFADPEQWAEYGVSQFYEMAFSTPGSAITIAEILAIPGAAYLVDRVANRVFKRPLRKISFVEPRDG